MDQNIEEASYDIVEWFPAAGFPICQEVFKYLSANDVIQASLVNKEWYKFTAESQQTANLKLIFRRNHLQEEDKDIVNNSKRKYENVEFVHIYFDDSDFYSSFLASKAGSFKSVVFKCCQAADVATLQKIFRSVEPTVKELAFTEMLVLNTSDPEEAKDVDFKTQWTFPNLKTLSIHDYAFNIFKFFYGCKNLKKFEWFAFLGTATHVVPILRNNRDLKVLSIGLEVGVLETLLEHLPEFSFKLQQLTIYRGPHSELLYAILEAQSQTLKVLDLHDGLNNACLELILKMPRLTSLTIGLRGLRFQRALPLNTEVVNLNLKDSPSQATFESFIRALPCLEHLVCDTMNDEQFNFLTRAVPALESLKVRDFKVSRFPEGNIFPKLKEFKGLLLNKDLQKPSGDGNFAVVVRKAMRDYFFSIRDF